MHMSQIVKLHSSSYCVVQQWWEIWHSLDYPKQSHFSLIISACPRPMNVFKCRCRCEKIVNIKYALLYHSQLIFCGVNIGHIAFYVFNVDHTKKKLSMVWKWCLCVSLCLIFFLISYLYIIIWCHNTGHPQLIVVCWVFPLDWFHHIYHITHIYFLCELSPIWMHNEGVTDF